MTTTYSSRHFAGSAATSATLAIHSGVLRPMRARTNGPVLGLPSRTQTGGGTRMTEHRIGTQEAWQAERDELLKEEKELTRRGDELAGKRRELPWVPVEKDYRFETKDGTKSLADLFDGRSQLR